MQSIIIKIQEYEKRQETLFPELQNQPFIEPIPYALGILEKGMESGRTSVALIAKYSDGIKEKNVIIQMSAGQLCALAAAAKGAATRFGETDL